MTNNDKYLVKYSNLFLVKGFLHSVILDLGRNDYEFITNPTYSFLMNANKKRVIDARRKNKNLLNLAIAKDWIFLCEKYEIKLFPEISIKYLTNVLIQNSNIIFEGNLRKLKHILELLCSAKVSCKYITIIIEFSISAIDFTQLCTLLGKFTIIKFEIFIKYNNQLLKVFKNINLRPSIISITVFESLEKPSFYKFIFVEQTLEFNFIDYNYFNPTLELFIESLYFNTYTNKKLLINESGNVFKSFKDRENLDIFNIEKIENIILKLSKINNWEVPKSKIDVCNVCEFRNMCIDSCDIMSRKDGTFYRAKECNYNPFISKWDNETNFYYLKDCGIICNTSGIKINKKKLENTLEKIYV